MTSNTCDPIRKQLAMLLYGELSFDEEERVETHLESCEDCRGALERERALLSAFDQVAVEPSPTLLRESRERLFDQLQSEPAPPHAAGKSWWDHLIDALPVPSGILRPAGAVALLAAGFFVARLAPTVGPFSELDILGNTAARLRSVEPAADGRVRIVLDETRQRTVSGGVANASIRALLLAATRDASDPVLRASTIEILGMQTVPDMANDVRDALVFTVLNDQNDSVRLKAIEGLKNFAMQPDVRNALSDVLLADGNPNMRNHAIDLLMQGLESSTGRTMDPRTIGLLQELMSKEGKDTYVRQRSQQVLQLVNASAEIF
jgi:hypothetical protein